jgi:hypothetical protein
MPRGDCVLRGAGDIGVRIFLQLFLRNTDFDAAQIGDVEISRVHCGENPVEGGQRLEPSVSSSLSRPSQARAAPSMTGRRTRRTESAYAAQRRRKARGAGGVCACSGAYHARAVPAPLPPPAKQPGSCTSRTVPKWGYCS